ncbi:MAG: hypothetical protein ACE5D1_05380, partial [Fidelibacterota bacterium]
MSDSPVFSLEEKYQALEQQLILFPADRVNLYRLVQFFTENSATLTNFRSYYIESAEWFKLLFHSTSLKFQRPEFYDRLFQVLKTGIQAVESGPIQALFHDLMPIWRRYAAEMQFFLGEYDSGLRIVCGEKDSLRLDGMANNGHATGYDHFRDWLKALKTSPLALEAKDWEVLEEIDARWKLMTQLSRDRIRTILISQDSGGGEPGGSVIQRGFIQSLLVTTELLHGKTGADVVVFQNKTTTTNDLAFQQSRDAVEAARKIYSGRRHRSKNRLKVIYSFPDTASLYTGDSMGFAMGMITVANLSRILESLREYRVPRNIAVTGAMDQYGKLRPISSDSLQIKMQAAFYSPVEAVGLPAENHEEALKIREQLTQSYPRRKLEIVPVKSLRETLNRPRLVVKKAVPVNQQLKIISRHWAAISALTVLTVLGLIFLPTWDTNPAHVQITKNNIEVSNRNNHLLWTHPIDTSFWPPIDKKDSALLHYSKHCLVTDMDRDRKFEVIVPLFIPENEEVTVQIMYFESDGNLK